ncbi:MAG: tetratricopeptide repeat protein [Pseudomonadota bacterium]
MVDSDDFLIREVKAELERERMQSLWQRYGTYIIGGVALIIASVAGYQYWQASTLAANQEAGAAYDKALTLVLDEKYDEALEGFRAVSESGSDGYSVLSQLQTAATLLDQDKPEEAASAFEKAANSGGDALLTGFARLQLAALKLGTADFTETENRLNGLISDENPWRFNAREMLGLAQLRSGRTDEARQSFEALLGDRAVPPAMQQRIQVLLAQIIAADVTAEAAAKTSETDGAVTPKGSDQVVGETVKPDPADAEGAETETTGETASPENAKAPTDLTPGGAGQTEAGQTEARSATTNEAGAGETPGTTGTEQKPGGQDN